VIALDTRSARLFKILLLPPLALLFFYGLWQWGAFLNEQVFSDDRVFHTLALETGMHNPTEPLWGIVAPAIGALFPDYPFEAISLLTLVLITVGLLLNRMPWPTFFLVSFSPGIAYLLTNATRQGFAVGAFLVLLGIARRWFPSTTPYRWWMPILLAVPTGLIHNAMAIVAGYMVLSHLLLIRTRYGRRSQYLQLALTVFGSTLYLVGRGTAGGTGLALLAVMPMTLAGSLVLKDLRSPLVPLVLAFMLVSAAGFILTPTGIRVLVMVSLIAFIAVPRRGGLLALAACWGYPLFLLAIGVETENLAPGL
jgi:hypothetical protein